MSAVSSPGLMTADELLRRSDALGRCELIEGELIMLMPPGGFHGWIAGDIFRPLDAFVQKQKLGRVFPEVGYLLERYPDTVRAPDVSFIAADRLDRAKTPKYIPIPPDLAVEVNSPNDRPGEVLEKVGWWLEHGVRLVWVVDPGTQTVAVYPGDAAAGVPRVLGRADTLDGGNVLPGFALPLTEVFQAADG